MGEVGRVGPIHPLYMSLGVPGGGVVGSRDPGVLFDSWVLRCPSRARVPLFSRVLKPIYDQITVYSTLIYH
jgi:hypothetical protein